MSGRHKDSLQKSCRTMALAAVLCFSTALCGCSENNLPHSNSSSDFSSTESSSVEYSSEISSVTSSSTHSDSQSSSQTVESSSEVQSSEFSSVSSSAVSSSNVGSSSSSFTSSKPLGSSSTWPDIKPPIAVIPDIKLPTSPGTAVISANNVVLDYSNAENGYVSVKYTGSSSRVKLRYVCGEKTYNFDVPVDRSVGYFPLSCGSGSYTFYVFEKIEGTTYSILVQQTVELKIENDIVPYSFPNSYVDFTKESDCVRKAAELCAGKEDILEKISAVLLYISDNIVYDKELAATVKSGYIPNPDRTLERKKGICFDYASLMAAMLRSQGIPTRLVIGYASPDIYHAWNEVYMEKTGWITPELLMNNIGYNIADATFYASAKDKQSISDYIMNSTNYSALYYY